MITVPARQLFRMKRSVSLLISDHGTPAQGSLVAGAYQSPILIQWHKELRQQRQVEITLTRIR
jgi:hypothetical protein